MLVLLLNVSKNFENKIGGIGMKTVCKNWELNFVCENCNMGVYNATEKPKKCDTCGKTSFKVIHPINTRSKLYGKS